MKRKLFLFPVAAVLLVSGILYSCSKSGNSGGSNSGSNDGKDILASLGNNIILPSYQTLAISVNSLDSAITDFNAAPASGKLTAVQGLFKAAYINWESVSAYNTIGPAGTNQPLLASLDVFPASQRVIDSNSTHGLYNVNALYSAAAKGFPALDYLLFTANALDSFTTDANASNRRQYLSAVSTDIKSEVNATLKGWQASGGNFIGTFLNATGNSVSSSLGLLINSLDFDFEILKNNKLGIPLGKLPGGQAGTLRPEEVEGLYSGISAQLALAQLKAAQNIFLGGNGLGLKDFLARANAQYHNGPLADTIKANFASAVSGLQAIPDPFSATLQSNPAPATAVYATVQRLVTLLKTDMPSSLGVLIIYGDNDGD